jgi:hypothetical protein
MVGTPHYGDGAVIHSFRFNLKIRCRLFSPPYLTQLINPPRGAATATDMMPVSASCVVSRDGRIKFTSFNSGCRRRVSVRRVAAAL